MTTVAQMVMAHRMAGASRADVRNPCAVCGWGPYMGIHQGPHGTVAFGQTLHEYVPFSKRAK